MRAWFRSKPAMGLFLALAGCAYKPPNVSEPIQTLSQAARYGGETHGAELSKLKSCGADPNAVVALASKKKAAFRYGVNGATAYNDALDQAMFSSFSATGRECDELKANADYASAFAPTRNLARMSRSERIKYEAEQKSLAEARVSAEKGQVARLAAESARLAQEAENAAQARRIIAQCRYESTLATSGMRRTFLGLEQSLREEQLYRLCVNAKL